MAVGGWAEAEGAAVAKLPEGARSATVETEAVTEETEGEGAEEGSKKFGEADACESKQRNGKVRAVSDSDPFLETFHARNHCRRQSMHDVHAVPIEWTPRHFSPVRAY